MSFFEKLKKGMSKTRENISEDKLSLKRVYQSR